MWGQALASTYEENGSAGASLSCHALDIAGYKGLLAGLAAVGHAAGLLDRDFRVLATNVAGGAFIEREFGARDGRLAGRTRNVDLRITRLIQSLESDPRAIAVIPALPDTPLVLQAMRLPAPVGRAETILTFSRLGETCLPEDTVLREGFGLTATEACIALSVARGHELRCIAQKRGVTLDTVRSHLRTIFAKTGTRRQAGLVLLIAGVGR